MLEHGSSRSSLPRVFTDMDSQAIFGCSVSGSPRSRAGPPHCADHPTAPGPLKPVALEAIEIHFGGGTEPIFTVVETKPY